MFTISFSLAYADNRQQDMLRRAKYECLMREAMQSRKNGNDHKGSRFPQKRDSLNRSK